jgi:hypothetical protein
MPILDRSKRRKLEFMAYLVVLESNPNCHQWRRLYGSKDEARLSLKKGEFVIGVDITERRWS